MKVGDLVKHRYQKGYGLVVDVGGGYALVKYWYRDVMRAKCSVLEIINESR